MAVQQLLVGAGPLGDAVDPRPGQAVFDELVDGRIEDPVGGGLLRGGRRNGERRGQMSVDV